VPSVTRDAVRLGVVGGGLITQIAHLPALKALTRHFALLALVDPSEQVRSILTWRYGIASSYATYEEMIDRTQLDAVLVASPNGTHARVTLDALEAGLHVLVEKPLCLAADDAAAIVADAERRRLVVQVGYMKRFDGAYEALRELLPEPRELELIDTATVDPGIGEMYRPADLVAPTDADPSAKRELRRCTEEQVARAVGSDDPRHVRPFSDAFLGALVHDVNLVLGLLEDLDLRPGEVTDAASAADGSLAYGACRLGDTATWTGEWTLAPGASAFSEELRVHAADGVRRLSFAAPYDASAPSRLEVAETARRFAPAARSYSSQLAHFHDCITTGARCRTPAAQGARDIELLTDLYRAAMAA
jgi:predicted dehydrogenase